MVDTDFGKDLPDDVRETLRACYREDDHARNFLRCENGLRAYDAFICHNYVRANTGSSTYDQCRADLAERRRLNRQRAAAQPAIIPSEPEPQFNVVAPQQSPPIPVFRQEPITPVAPLPDILPPPPIRCQPGGYGSVMCR